MNFFAFAHPGRWTEPYQWNLSGKHSLPSKLMPRQKWGTAPHLSLLVWQHSPPSSSSWGEGWRLCPEACELNVQGETASADAREALTGLDCSHDWNVARHGTQYYSFPLLTASAYVAASKVCDWLYSCKHAVRWSHMRLCSCFSTSWVTSAPGNPAANNLSMSDVWLAWAVGPLGGATWYMVLLLAGVNKVVQRLGSAPPWGTPRGFWAAQSPAVQQRQRCSDSLAKAHGEIAPQLRTCCQRMCSVGIYPTAYKHEYQATGSPANTG